MLFIYGRYNDDSSNAISVESKNRKINKRLIKKYRKESDCGLISVQVSRSLPGGTEKNHDNLDGIVDIFTENQIEHLEFVKHRCCSFINVAYLFLVKYVDPYDSQCVRRVAAIILLKKQ